MGIIEYFKRLKRKFLARKWLQTERKKRLYERCRQGIFSFFKPYLTKTGFYLELKDKKGLINYLFENKKQKTIEDLISKRTSPSYSPINPWEKTKKYTIYNAFRRMVDYFNEFPKEQLRNYTSLSFNYKPAMTGYRVYSHKNKLSFSFG